MTNVPITLKINYYLSSVENNLIDDPIKRALVDQQNKPESDSEVGSLLLLGVLFINVAAIASFSAFAST